MPRNFIGGDAGQGYLMPPDVREWLPAGHLAWGLVELTGQMDLAPFTGWYRADGQGRPAYHPAMMVTLVCYCFCKGIRSSRGIEAATFDDVGARVICGNLHPDHATAHRFLVRHEQAVRGLLAASVAACAKRGLVSAEVVAGDGTKVRASASPGANLTAEQLDAQIGELEQAVAARARAWLDQVMDADAQDALAGVAGGADGGGADDGDAGGAGGGRKGAAARAMLERRRQARGLLAAREQQQRQDAQAGRDKRVSRLEARAARSQQAAAALAAAADAKAADYQRRAAGKAAAGSCKRPDGRAPAAAKDNAHVRRAGEQARKAAAELEQALTEPAAAASPGKPPRINTTDPSSMVMQAKNGGFGQLHNLQAAACRSSQVILAIGTHPSPVDVAALHPLLQQTRATLDAAGIADPIGKALFDAGYASDANFTADCQAELYVAVTREARQTGRLRDGIKPATRKDSWQQMDAKISTPAGRALYKQRSAIIEPVFAQLFTRLGRHLNYRGDRVSLELSLWGTSHNLLKALRARPNRPAQTAPAT